MHPRVAGTVSSAERNILRLLTMQDGAPPGFRVWGRGVGGAGYDPPTRFRGDTLRHTVTAAAVAALLLALTACGNSDSSGQGGSGKSATTAGTPSPSTSAEREGQYILASQDIAFATRRPSNEELLAFPPQWCAGLDDGHSVAWLFSGGGGDAYPLGEGWGTVKKNAYRLLVVGVRVYCPEHTDAVTKELRESGEY